MTASADRSADLSAVDLRAQLRALFGHDGFRPGQEAVVRAVLAGRDVVAVMPTGSGKSIGYQLPALLLDGPTLVVSPLIALMKDQVDALQAAGHAATFINSSLDPDEQDARLRACVAGQFRLLFVAPERIGSERFVEACPALRVARLAVDEAHCVSQWGHDFRPDYLRLAELRNLLGAPPTAAFTATATARVRTDIVRQLGLVDPHVFVAGFERPNLRLLVHRPETVARKLALLDEAIARNGTPAIVYAATRKNVEQAAAHLRSRGIDALAYHAGLAAAERERVQDAFMDGASPVIVATPAFGMGVDKADVRLVVHYDVPGSVEQYWQEAGRAGRDGKPAECVLLYNFADVRIQRFFIDGANPEPAVYRHVLDRCADGLIDLSAIEGDAPTKNQVAVETAVRTLRRAGALVRVEDPATGDERYVLAPDTPRGEVPLDLDALAAKREGDDERLRAICGYASGSTCRRAVVLRYFGSDDVRDACGACDRCEKVDRPATRALNDDERRIVRIALSGVARVDDRFGRSRIANFLAGARTKDVLSAGLDRLPTHGKLAHLPIRRIGDLLEALADEGLLRRRGIDGPGSASVLGLTAEGRRVMRDDPPLALALPSLANEPTTARRGRGAPSLVAMDDAVDGDVLQRLRASRLADARGARPAARAASEAPAGSEPSTAAASGEEVQR
ncbi:MAG: ATP-dependent DNA helicase [Planctomycetes bacterium]|nr:ATP-dependent DNA helicase [Planctomycetota bacterium]